MVQSRQDNQQGGCIHGQEDRLFLCAGPGLDRQGLFHPPCRRSQKGRAPHPFPPGTGAHRGAHRQGGKAGRNPEDHTGGIRLPLQLDPVHRDGRLYPEGDGRGALRGAGAFRPREGGGRALPPVFPRGCSPQAHDPLPPRRRKRGNGQHHPYRGGLQLQPFCQKLLRFLYPRPPGPGAGFLHEGWAHREDRLRPQRPGWGLRLVPPVPGGGVRPDPGHDRGRPGGSPADLRHRHVHGRRRHPPGHERGRGALRRGGARLPHHDPGDLRHPEGPHSREAVDRHQLCGSHHLPA